jgi:two-component system OmpR family sensor kinase
LRIRLVAGLLLLAAAGLSAADFSTIVLLRSYLVARGDDQLSAVRARLEPFENGGPLPAFMSSPPLPTVAGLFSDYVIDIRDAAGTITGRYTNNPHAPPPDVAPVEILRSRGQLDRPFYLTATGPGSVSVDYRVLVWVHARDQGSTVVALNFSPQTATTTQLIQIEVPASVLILGLLGVLGWAVVRVVLRPLDDVEKTAEAIVAAGDLSRRIPVKSTQRTEIDRLASTVNTMLSRLETAFTAHARSEDRLRQFVADASHELRTPLAGIRGFAELYRQGAVRQPDDVAHLIARIEAESTRMGLLVEDLLLLARLDRQRPPESEPVDLVAIAADAVEAARAIAPERPLRLVILPELTRPGATAPVVLGDEGQLRQVAANLLGNALQHTPPDTSVLVRAGVVSGTDAEMVIFEVADHGDGLTIADAERVFERFYRADAARGRRNAPGKGAGLGLSIVAAIVAAHRGRVEHFPTHGGGATFRVAFTPAPHDG